MAKIDYSKVEQNLGEALHRFFIQKLVEGESVKHPRASSYVGLEQNKPIPQDSVIQALMEIDKEEEKTLP
ncbi:MAG: hypothetical protein JSR46_08330, partial [Verrucomicrobia bacterium]|nr:hypothetical protein [Verrucomicrobiota bacterium]